MTRFTCFLSEQGLAFSAEVGVLIEEVVSAK